MYGDYSRKVDSRINSLAVPYIFWNVFWLGYALLKAWKMRGVADTELLQLNDVGDFFACFWMKGYGTHPDFPIAGYTWFLRDLFVFALLSPMYYYCYAKRRLANAMAVVLVLTSAVDGWEIPGFNAWIYVGGLIAVRGWSLERICDKARWIYVIPCFLVVNYLYFHVLAVDGILSLLVIATFVLVMKTSLALHEVRWLRSMAAASMYVYVTHILVLNISRHSLAKILTIDSDFMMCVYYIVNSMTCVVICIGSYYIMKQLKANRLLGVMTGGRL